MEFTLSLITLLAIFAVTLAQQQPQPTQENAPLAPQGRSSPLLGVRYSAATDVSHISFNSPLVTYGSSLNEIRLPAAPIQPANLKQISQGDNSAAQGDEGNQQGQTLVRRFGNQGQAQQQQVQTPAPADQQQFISVQHYPANPQAQAQSNSPSFSLSQQTQRQQQSAPRYASQFPVTHSQPQFLQQQPQFPQPQQYTTSVAQPQFATSVAQPQYATSVAQPQYATSVAQPQQFGLQQPQTYVPPLQQYVAPQQLPLQYPRAPVTTNTYFATGPYAAQPVLPQPIAPVLPQYAQPTAPAAPLVSRVAFNGPIAGFSYSF